jgi:hypothetical protein
MIVLKNLLTFKTSEKINQWLYSWKILIAFSIFLTSSVIILYKVENQIEFSHHQSRKDASGFSYGRAQHFFYFQYYLNLFPIAIPGEKEYNKTAATSLLQQKGYESLMEVEHWTRLGENARIWAFYPSAIWNKSAENPTLKGFNSLVFLISLLIFFVGFFAVKMPLQGMILTIMLLLTPFFHYEVFARENIFALLHCSFLILLGINLPIIFGGYKKFLPVFISSIITGIIIGFFTEMRAEIKALTISFLLIYTFSKYVSLKLKLVGILLFFLFFGGTKWAIRQHFDNKFDEAAKIVRIHKGNVYTGNRIKEHNFWHPVFCGLSDFGSDKGYEWDDRIAYNYALPIMKEKYEVDYKYSGQYHLDEYYDLAHKYYIKFDEIDGYEDIIKANVLEQITKHPWWYLKILLKRVWVILTITIPFNYLGILLVPLVVLLFWYKNFNYLLLFFASLSLSATPLIIYSGRGTAFNSMYPYFILLFLLLVIIEVMHHRFWKNAINP